MTTSPQWQAPTLRPKGQSGLAAWVCMLIRQHVFLVSLFVFYRYHQFNRYLKIRNSRQPIQKILMSHLSRVKTVNVTFEYEHTDYE